MLEIETTSQMKVWLSFLRGIWIYGGKEGLKEGSTFVVYSTVRDLWSSSSSSTSSNLSMTPVAAMDPVLSG